MSAADRPEVLKRQFEEEVEEGLMQRMALGEARAKWKEHLALASLGGRWLRAWARASGASCTARLMR